MQVRTPVKEKSARNTDHCLLNIYQKETANIHVLSGTRLRYPSIDASTTSTR